MPIYCDEAGNNGNDLLQESQPYFVYAALNIQEADAEQMVQHLKTTYRLQGVEPKGVNIVRTKHGQAAILDLYERYADQVRIVYHHKKYALACKFFEYIFEPAISSFNMLFYRSNFHRFIANVVFEGLMLNPGSPEKIFREFQLFVKGENFDGIFNALKANRPSDIFISQIIEYAILHKEAIVKDIQSGGGVEPWILDLAQSGLYDLLIQWGQEIGELTVFCDTTHALKHVVENHLVYEPNQEVRRWDPFGDGEIPINFKLSAPIVLTSSKKHAGIQLVDMFASSVYYTLKNPEDEFAKKLFPFITKITENTGRKCIMPQPNLYSTPGTPSFDFGMVALKRLIEFSHIDKANAGKLFVEYMMKGIKNYNSLSN